MVIDGFMVIYGDDLWDTTSKVLFRPPNDGFLEGIIFIAGRKSQRFFILVNHDKSTRFGDAWTFVSSFPV